MADLYRRWAATRHRQLQSWVAEWATDEMYAGVASMSAEEAWYSTALLHEKARRLAEPATGASIDIHKCADQISKTWLYRVMAEAGCPDELISAFRRYLGNLDVSPGMSTLHRTYLTCVETLAPFGYSA